MPILVEQTTAAVSTNFVLPWVPLNLHTDTFNVRYEFTEASGAGGFAADVQGTLADPALTSVPTFIVNSMTSASVGNLTAPARAIRMRVSASGSTDLTFRVLQVGV